MKRFIYWAIAAAVLMVLIPHLGNFSMPIAFLLFYAVNPIFAAVCGAAAGRHIKRLWPLPLLTAALFLVGCGLWFTLTEIQFWYYSGIYLAVGTVTMLLSAAIKSRT